MTETRSYAQPIALGSRVQTLEDILGAPGLTVSDCESFGREKVDLYQAFTPCVTKERPGIFAPDVMVEPIFSTIVKCAHTSRVVDGKVSMAEVLKGGKIRTGERGGYAA